MAKELYLYQPIYSYTAEAAVRALNDVSNSEDLTIRVNCPGGEVNAGWSIVSRMSERTGKTNMIIDGMAASMAAIMLMYSDYTVSNDTSDIMFHQAAYPTWYEPTEAEKIKLKTINDTFKSKITKKVEGKPGAEDFLAKLFEEGKRNDVSLTPKEAKKLGIVDEIRILEPKAFDFNTPIVALFDDEKEKPKGDININQNKQSMTLAELKEKHPELYAQVIALGVAGERDRVGAWMAFNSIDPEAVAKGINDGENMSQKAMAEFTAKGIAAIRTQDHKDESPEGTDTSKKDGKTAEQIKAEKQDAEMQAELVKLGLNPKA